MVPSNLVDAREQYSLPPTQPALTVGTFCQVVNSVEEEKSQRVEECSTSDRQDTHTIRYLDVAIISGRRAFDTLLIPGATGCI